MYKNKVLKITWVFVTLLTTVLNPQIQSGCLVTAGGCCVAQVLPVLGAGGDELFQFGFQLNDVAKAERDDLAC